MNGAQEPPVFVTYHKQSILS